MLEYKLEQNKSASISLSFCCEYVVQSEQQKTY
jgi:hypothetical protein